MGQCTITIHVTGAHHNKSASDIDQMAAEFVKDLSKLHNVTAAYMCNGAEQDLKNTTILFPKQDSSSPLDGHEG